MGTRKRTHFILRYFDSELEVFRWRTLPPFDGFIVNIQYDRADQIAEIARMVAAGKKYFRYYSAIDYPFCGDNFGGRDSPPFATLLNWVRDNVQFNGTASFKRLRVGSTVGLFSYYNVGGERRELVPWKDVTGSLMQSLAQKIVDLSHAPGGVEIPCSGLMLDQSWLTHRSWMYGTNGTSGHGDTKESAGELTPLTFANAEANNFGVTGTTWSEHQAAFQNFLTEIRTRFAAYNPAGIIWPNGQHYPSNSETIPMPWFCENAWNNPEDGALGNQPLNWSGAQSYWLADKRNLLQIKVYGALANDGSHATSNAQFGVSEALTLWKGNGGWINFGAAEATTEAFTNTEHAFWDAAMIQGGIA